MGNHTQLVQAESVTIASGASLSGAVFIGGDRVVAIEMPATWTAAHLTFQASSDGTTYTNLYSGDAEADIAVAAAQTFMLDFLFNGALYVKVRSGTSGTPVNQAADRVVKLLTVPIGM